MYKRRVVLSILPCFFWCPSFDGLPPICLVASKHGRAKRLTLLLYGKVKKNMNIISIHNTC
jgi:hypothetical protein